jgi:hypothetical protein
MPSLVLGPEVDSEAAWVAYRESAELGLSGEEREEALALADAMIEAYRTPQSVPIPLEGAPRRALRRGFLD